MMPHEMQAAMAKILFIIFATIMLFFTRAKAEASVPSFVNSNAVEISIKL